MAHETTPLLQNVPECQPMNNNSGGKTPQPLTGGNESGAPAPTVRPVTIVMLTWNGVEFTVAGYWKTGRLTRNLRITA